MICSFFGKAEYIATIQLENQKTISSEWYVSQCIPKVLEKCCDRRPKTGTRGLLWHHDNAPAHKAARTVDFLNSKGVQILPHLPYSPDLAPNDFFLFPEAKLKLRGYSFSSPEDAVIDFQEVIDTMPKESWSNCFERWFYRMKLCIQSKGEYFEKR